jgi:RNA polymerase sigma-70 factor (ECF subfamily)
MDDSPTQSEGAFPTTRWSLVGRAKARDSFAEPVAIAEIARLYFRALRAHLLQRTRGDEHRADDLLQGFLADKVLEQRLIDRADPERGRFRTFLLAALDRYVIDQFRAAAAQKRSPRGELQDVDVQRDSLAAGSDNTDAFDVVWAREVLGEVLAMTRHQCEQTNRPELWDVFEVRYLLPATQEVEPESHESIARRLRLDSPKAAANLLVTAKRMFTRNFKLVVSQYAVDEREVRDEVTNLWQIFSTATR